ncbi:hypothetical protein KPLM21_290055 [Klebsiella pneumoniae]|nr:hypothetical protein KPLM21_290055 [Klebsiella pneumoniae]CTQ27283.1 hypothetical protein CH1034_170037 [Klebsiella pneumoniae]
MALDIISGGPQRGSLLPGALSLIC